jgi:hypothetical protein
LVDDEGFNASYGICPSPIDLTNHIGMRLHDFNIYHLGQGLDFSNSGILDAIGLGYACSDILPAKLSVNENFSAQNVTFSTGAGFFHNSDAGINLTTGLNKTGIVAIADGVTLNGGPGAGVGLLNLGGDFSADNCNEYNIGVRGIAGSRTPDNPGLVIATGGHFEGRNGAKISYGVNALANGNRIGQSAVGVYSAGDNATVNNVGVYAITAGGAANVNYGIYASAPVGFCPGGGPCVAAAGYFNGNVYTTAGYVLSDASIKQNVQPLQNALDIINELNPKTYTFNTNQNPKLNLPAGIQDGLIAQELEMVLPELVNSLKVPPSVDSTGNVDTTGTSESYKAINYVGIIPYLIQGMKEQQEIIQEMQAQLDNCCNSGNRQMNPDGEQHGNSIDIELSNAKAIVLNQNVPNPFAEQTSISYFITDDVKKAQIFFYDNRGTILKIVDINEKGAGQINVFAADLSSGHYTYTLIADGKVIESKTMVKQ